MDHGSTSDGPADSELIAATNAQHRAHAGDTCDAEPSDDDEATSEDDVASEVDGDLPATKTAIVFAYVLFPCAAMFESGVKGASVVSFDLINAYAGSLIDDHAWTKVRSAVMSDEIKGVVLTPHIATFASTLRRACLRSEAPESSCLA